MMFETYGHADIWMVTEITGETELLCALVPFCEE
jgi:hypothetical protein